MRIISWDDFIKQDDSQKVNAVDISAGIAATVGMFDGVHLGHQALIRSIVQQKDGLIPTIITFAENPKSVLHPESFQGHLSTIKQKLRMFESFHIQQVVLIDFSGNFSKLGGREFVDLLRIRGSLRYLAIGSNFRCGYKLDTDAPLIKEMNAEQGIFTDVVEPVTASGIIVSSSRIRAAIRSGDLVEARSLFGRNVEIDVSAMSKTPGRGEIIFDAASSFQITPPKGRYPVLLYETDSNEGIETEVCIDDGNIIIPSSYHADSIEFISNNC